MLTETTFPLASLTVVVTDPSALVVTLVVSPEEALPLPEAEDALPLPEAEVARALDAPDKALALDAPDEALAVTRGRAGLLADTGLMLPLME